MEIKKAIKRALTKKSVLFLEEKDGLFFFEALTTSLFFKRDKEVFGLAFRGTLQILKLKNTIVVFEVETATLKEFDKRLLFPFRVWRLDPPFFLESNTLLVRDWTELFETEETESAEARIRSCFERLQVGVGIALSKILLLGLNATLLARQVHLPKFRERIEIYLSGLTAPEFRSIRENLKKTEEGYFGLFSLKKDFHAPTAD